MMEGWKSRRSFLTWSWLDCQQHGCIIYNIKCAATMPKQTLPGRQHTEDSLPLTESPWWHRPAPLHPYSAPALRGRKKWKHTKWLRIYTAEHEEVVTKGRKRELCSHFIILQVSLQQQTFGSQNKRSKPLWLLLLKKESDPRITAADTFKAAVLCFLPLDASVHHKLEMKISWILYDYISAMHLKRLSCNTNLLTLQSHLHYRLGPRATQSSPTQQCLTQSSSGCSSLQCGTPVFLCCSNPAGISLSSRHATYNPCTTPLQEIQSLLQIKSFMRRVFKSWPSIEMTTQRVVLCSHLFLKMLLHNENGNNGCRIIRNRTTLQLCPTLSSRPARTSGQTLLLTKCLDNTQPPRLQFPMGVWRYLNSNEIQN